MTTSSIQPASPLAHPSSANPRQLLSADTLGPLNRRSNLNGTLQLAAHLTVTGLSGLVWGGYLNGWPLPSLVVLPALIVYGSGLAFMFCAVHECVHRTAFASNRANDAIAWLAGLLSFYNSTFYRRYHKWHHRYTRVEGKDPELTDLQPANWAEYLWVLSGIPWWKGKVVGHVKVALGQLEGCFYLPESAYAEVIHSTRLQLVSYGAIALFSAAVGHPWFLVTYWLLPLAIGQPLLRFVLLAEHTGCSYGDNPLTNTRTTLTLWPLRFLMWNMPYHAEHHLYPSIPFHALPAAHHSLKTQFASVDSGYLQVNKTIVQQMG
ncbi:MAG: fatty acid desaturase [Phormidesmis sp.]